MKTKTLLLSGLAVVLGLVIANWIMFKPSAPRESARANTVRMVSPEPQQNPTPPDPSPAEQASNISRSAQPQQTVPTDVAQKVAPQSIPTKKPKPPLQDPVARVALSFVGVDPDAEQYWLEAINDPSLSAHERQDLIEDLNEDGLSDPRRPTTEDLPLIVNRLLLLEEIDAMDEVNADAIQEAYKDLANMYLLLTQR